MELLRIDKIISSQTGMSRSDARDAIRRGEIVADGRTVRSGDEKIDPSLSVISYRGEMITYRKFTYIMMNKPLGVVSATTDPKEPTVLGLLPASLRRNGLFPAGRLDKDTTGMLIITDDGDFAHRMLAPGKGTWKTYEATLDGPLPEGAAEAFSAGIMIGGGEVCLPAEVEKTGKNTVRVRIREGKYHQVKRMFTALSLRVISLRRMAIGTLSLDESLAPGECRLLREDEIGNLLKNH